MITDKAKHVAKSLQEQLEECRKALQQGLGEENMRTVDAHLEQDGEFVRMPVDGAD